MITFDSSLLMNYYQARAGLTGGGAAGPVLGGPAAPKLPTPPWSERSKVPPPSQLVNKALLGAKYVNLNAAQLDVPGSSDDYRKLFALYQGLSALHGVAEASLARSLGPTEHRRHELSFNRGLAEIVAFTGTLKLEQVRLARGKVSSQLRTDVGVRRDKAEYVTGVLHSGSSTAEVAAFQGAVKFDIAVKRGTVASNIAIDLTDMGSTPRTMANVVNHINAKFQAAGLTTRFATERLPNEPRTVQVGGKAVTLPAGVDSWALKVKGDTIEQLTFSAQATAGAVYIGQAVGAAPKTGEPDLTERQLLKFQTDTAAVPATNQGGGEANWVEGRVFSEPMGKAISAIRSTHAGPDGSVYVLAEVTDKTGDQTIKAERDVALLKYDSAGTLMFTRTLGAAEAANGYALTVAADGKVAIAGSVKGELGGAVEGPINSTTTSGAVDSFVTLFNADGEELWTVQRGARENDEARAVAFGADGTVYVAGRTQSSLPGATSVGAWDGYLTAIATQSTGLPKTLFTRQFGTTGNDGATGVAVSGNSVYVAGVEDGDAVVRAFTVTPTNTTTQRTTVGGETTTTVTTAVNGAPTDVKSSTMTTGAADGTKSTTYTTAASAAAGAVRNLGDLGGGQVAGLALNGSDVIIAGSTRNGSLAGAVTTAHSGGSDAFVARLSSDLTAQGVTYFGGDGDEGANALTVSGGKVWITGSTTSADLDGAAKLGTRDGFIASLDPASGAVAWKSRFTARDGQVSPTSISVDQTGVSVLDKLGLPKGTLDYKDSQLLTSATSLRAGDQFFVRAREGARASAVTIAANDTLQTLAQKIRRAAGFSAKVEVVKSGAYSRLQIKPLNDRSVVEIIAGKGGTNALEALGLAEGIAKPADPDDDKPIYGLDLSKELSLDDDASAKAAVAQLTQALAKIRNIYRDLQRAGMPESTGRDFSGPVPAYLQAQLANYQAGLSRLTG